MKILSITSRTVTIELNNRTIYYAKEVFSIYLNQVFIREESKNVFTLFDLKPDFPYTIEIGTKSISFQTKKESVCLNVKDFNAIGDGVADDTVKIQAAIACCPKDGCVYLPKGTYLVSTIFLKSDMLFYLDKEAKLLAKYERLEFPVLPGRVGAYTFGTWEGSFVDGFASTITAISCHNLSLAGLGEIDEQATLGDWYKDHRVKRIAYRGFGMYFKDCKDIEVIGLHIHDTPSWNIHPFFSENLKFLNLRIENNPSMPTTDGLDPDCCNNCLIAGCYFNVGDDCIAIKSGTYELAKEFKRPSQNIFIRNNYMEQGHGGVVFGSESSGGILNVRVEQCIFKNTDRGLRIKTRRGRGRIGKIHNVLFQNILMDAVKTPFVINMYYNMGPAGGHEEYVWTTTPQPVTELTPMLGKFEFKDMLCKNVGYAAGVFIGLPEAEIEGITLENVRFQYDPQIEEGYPVMIEHNFKLKNAGLYCFHVKNIELKHVVFDGVLGERLIKKES